MAKRILLCVVLLQIGVALSCEGLYRSIAELTAFLTLFALILLHRKMASRETLTHSTEG
ncbi:hypothetical protein [Vibrio cidicii]|uniref:hypothetical protein n=1 Tax=Vibrio cidicii TaxID=1763883 RepID=UPI000A99FF09|nr:hypothetical protein [Vibrio cidicii]EJN6827248.1 hypothetical protein [Vibrio cidicii]